MRAFYVVAVSILASLARPAWAQQDRDIVKVNGTPIRQSEVFERLWKLYGPTTVEEMVDELLLRQAVQRAKIQIPQAAVDQRLGKVREQFQDPRLLEAELASAGSTVEKLKEDLREELAREKLLAEEKKLVVGEEELKKAFAQHKNELGQREAVHLRHILVASKQDADAVAAEIKSGADFGKVARERSLAPTGKINGGDYGFVARGMLPSEIESAAFALKENELRVIPSQKGFHVLQALERRPAVPAQYAKVKEDLREILLQEKVKAALPDYLKQLRAKADIKTDAH